TGSLALGGFVVSCALMMNLTIYIVIVAFIYLAEVCSVIIQVLYFKATGGKRFFKMAPIHHHYELKGWSEVKVVTVFTAITFVLAIVGLVAM
ncbi:MAG: phospho-N-acetylmuramoyl-pentapeptide-transferase, partial [Lachnospiraceae bacterium]|nr:phospho-N-acetylmuramoyl-pentapeptide-transferase [Lachnospiraceae bacterium]